MVGISLKVSEIVMLFDYFIKDKENKSIVNEIDTFMYKVICLQIANKFSLDKDDTK